MFFTPWLRSVSRRIRFPKLRRRNRLSHKQHQLLLRGPQVVSPNVEGLEERCVMTIGPGLVSVTPNAGLFLTDGEIRTDSPRELVFQFSPGHVINTSTLGAIEILRSGQDGIFGNGNDVSMPAAYVDALSAAEPNKIVYRFASTPVDDHYRIIVHGTGPGTVLSSNLGVFGDTINDANMIGADAMLDFELDLGAQVVAVVPQPVTRIAGVLTQATNQIEVYFNDDDLVDTSAVAENPAFYQLIDTKGTASTADDTISIPTSVTYDPALDKAVLTFASIPTGTYKLKIGSSQESDGTTTTAVNLGTLFSGSGFTTTAVLGDTSGGPTDADLYRFELSAGGTVTVTATPSSSLDTVIELLDASGAVIGMPADTPGVGNPDTLNSGALAAGTYFARITSSGASTTGSYRLDIAVSNALAINDDNSSYATATDLGVLGAAGKTLSSQIEPQGFIAIPDMPGASDEPGHRSTGPTGEGSHGVGALGSATIPGMVRVQEYNFAPNYGTLFGSPLINQITEGQKSRIREIFELWSRDFGIQFVETANSGFHIIVGDARAVDPTLPIGISVSAGSTIIMSAASLGTDESYGGGFMGVAMHEIGHSLGLGHAGDLHSFMDGGTNGNGGPNGETLYGEHDAVHLRNIYPLHSTDIDLYKFNVTETGTFTAGITAELRSTASLLDSALTLFRDPFATTSSDFGSGGAATLTFTSDSAGVVGNDIQLVVNKSALGTGGVPTVSVNGHTITVTLDTVGGTNATQLKTALDGNAQAALLINTTITGAGGTNVTGLANGTTLALGGGNREVIARNDDYNSNDSFLSITLDPGTYYVGVTSTGNTSYDPTIAYSGYGGNTQGAYDLQLSFTTAPASSLTDTDNVGNLSAPATAQTTSLNGDADGTAGGDFQFWFQSGTTVFVDKTYVGSESGDILTPYNDIASALLRAATRIVAPVSGAAEIQDGDYFTITDGTNPTRVFEFDRTDVGGGVNGSNIAISIAPGDSASTIATNIAIAINNQQSLGNILTTAVATGDHVDLNNLTSLDVQHSNGLLNAPNLVRIVGNGGTDGDLATEADATPYVVGVNNFGATLADGRTFDVPQGVTVMIDAGTVIKLQNANIDVGTDPDVIGPNRQDGALQILGTPKQTGTANNAVYLTSFRNDAIGGNSDGSSPGPVAGQWGGVIFRRDSDMNDSVFGDQDGGDFFLNSVYQADISYGGGAAPTVFSAIHIVDERPTIAFSRITNSADAAISANPNAFDDSLDRIGPDIHGNTLIANSVNGLLVRIRASVSGPVDKLDVRGRFNDTDLTHVISEQLHITGNAGGAVVVNEIQQLDVQGTPVSGFFTLTSSASGTTATTSLNTPITASQTSFTVANATVLPGGASFVAPFNIRVGTEEMRVTNKVGNTLTVVRGVNGTSGVAHNTADTVARSQITTALSNTATAAEIQLALEFLDGIGEGNVRVTGGSLPQAAVNIEYIGPLGSASQLNRISVDNTPPGEVPLTGGNVVLTRVTVGGVQTARPGGRLQVDPGVVVKLSDARIEGERGSSQLIAEGTDSLPVIFTSLQDDRFGGASGTFDTSNNGFNTFAGNTAAKGDWGGLFFGQGSRINVDEAYIAYGGGNVPIAGGNANFAAIEVHEADLRLTNTTFEFNANGADGSARNFRGGNDGSVVFVRGAQPIIINNTFHNNDGSVISIDVNALKAVNIKDTGRTTGSADVFDQFANNQGPLVRLNRMENDLPGFSGVLGMEIRAGELTAEGVWDDTDIVHVIESGIITIDNIHTVGGLRLQSAPDASLVVKLGAGAGFDIGNPDKDGNNQIDAPPDDGPLEIDDRIGGTMQVIGAPGFPVVLTSIHDDSVGASLNTTGFPQTDTNGNGSATSPAAGNWGEILFNKYAHDRNVVVINELEKPLTGGIDTNSRLISTLDNNAEDLGNLAPNNKSANENRRAGFEIHGHIAQDDPTDVDIYKFVADAGTEIWLDIDFVDPALDTIVEFVSSNGTLLARSQDNTSLLSNGVNALPLLKSPNLGNDYYTTTVRDAGMRLIAPGAAGTTNTYFIRVRSNPAAGNINDLNGGLTSGEYQLQVRLGQRDETPGVAVKFADIRYATNGIHVKGLPYHSPLLGESSEVGTNDATNNTATPSTAILLGNLLTSDRASFSAGGNLTSATDIDFYKFHIDITKIQEIAGINGGPQTWATIIDLDWADGLTRPDTTIAVFTQAGQLVYIGRESNVADDQPAAGQGNDLDDLTRGSIGKLDPFIGSAMFEEDVTNGNEFYYLAVVNNQMQPQALSANFLSGSANATRTRLEPVTSLRRIAEDHIGFQGYTSNGTKVDPVSGPLLDITDATSLSTHATNFDLGDVVLFVSQDNQLRMVNPLTGANVVVYDNQLSGGSFSTRDIAMSSDGILFGYQNVQNAAVASNYNTVGRLVRLDTGTGIATLIGNDNISGESATPTSQSPLAGGGGGNNDFDDITTSDTVDAMVVERTSTTSNLPTYVGWYAVNENGRDATNAISVNSKLYRANLTTGAVANGTGDSGFGDIQYTGVVYASGTAFVSDGTNSVAIFMQAKAPGLAGNGITLDLQNNGGNNATINAPSFAGGTLTVNFGRNATAQQIVDAVNQSGVGRQYLTLSIANGGNGGIAPGTGGFVTDDTTAGGQDDPTNGVLRGNVTGLAFNTAEPNNSATNLLYGVTSAGELISINRNTPSGSGSTRMTATLITDFLNSANANVITARGAGFTGFTALTLGPQNLHDGVFRQTLFATTNTGRLIAFEIGGADDGVTLMNAFGTDNETQTLTSNATSGTFTLSYTYPLTGEVLTTVPLNFNATAGQVSAALQALVTSSGLFPFQSGDISVAGGPLNTTSINITFQGFYAGKAVNDLVLNNIDLAGGVANVSETVTGGDGLRTQAFVTGLPTNATGLAFSNLDINLWHPTMRRGDSGVDTVGAADPGHGINLAFDNSRAPQDEDVVIQGRNTTEAQGGASFYFGLEAYQPNAAQTAYLNYQSGQSQYGVADDDYHRDLTANVLGSALGLGTQISNNYNLPGGAYGTLTTNPINLSGYTSGDKPTLYFNYWLSTQDASAAQGQTTMRDSARVFASTDGGRTWSMIATNNTQLAAELPEFLAHSSDYNSSPIQELFDTGNWRQARIDLSQFATAASVQFRFDFSTAGKINEAGLGGEDFGQFSDADGGNAEGKAQNNNFEGFYIDDIIVGFAERGELITGAPTDSTGFDNLYTNGFAGGKANINNLMEPPTIVTSGTYQFEIRRGTEYAFKGDPKDPIGPINVSPGNLVDTNDRLIVDFSTPPAPLRDIFDPLSEYSEGIEDFATAPGSSADWFRATLGAFPTGSSAPYAFRSGPISAGQQSGVQLQVDTGAGKISFLMAVDAANFSSPGGIPDTRTFNGLKFLIDGVEQQFVIAGNALPAVPGVFDFGAGEADGFIFPGTGTATPAFVPVSFDISAGLHTFEWRYAKGVNAATFGTDSAYIDDLIIPQPATQGRLGDQNVEREQGMVVLEGNFIRNVSGTGIIVEPGNRDTGSGFPTNLPYGGAPRQTPTPNTQLLVTHAALVNNVITNFGTAGIRFSGDANTGSVPDAAVPFGKIINNTIYGGGTATGGTGQAGTGIIINNNASPTLINNIIANTVLGIDTTGNATSPQAADISTTLFQNIAGNNYGTTGNSPILNPGNTSPLFVNPAAGNFYLAAGTAGNANEAIDASLNQRFARPNYTAVTNPLGIPPDYNPFDLITPGQDQFAPDIDRFGQIRRDDPNTSNALGIFRDIGGIERADFAGPTANLTTPLDNGAEDLEPNPTVVAIDDPVLFTQFVVTLLDFDTSSGQNGIGVDDTGIGLTSGSAFTITQTDINGTRVLVSGTDYFYAYNANTNEAIFTSLTVFPSEARYNILVENNPLDPDAVFDLAGNVLQNNQLDGSVQFDILVTNGVNDAPDVTVPPTQTTQEDTPITLSVANGNAITIADPDAFLNNGDIQVTLTATNGSLALPDTPANLGLTLTFNDIYGMEDYNGADGTLVIRGSLAEVNAALDGLIFTPGADVNDPLGTGVFPNDDIRLNFVVNDLGNYWVNPMTGLLDSPQTDTGEIRFIVTPVNDEPIFTLPASFTVDEDEDTDGDGFSIAQLGLGFVTGIGPGPVTADDEAGQMLTFTVTVQAASAAAAAALFATGPSIDPLTGNLTFTLNADASGSATFDVVLTDDGSNVSPNDNTSVTQSFTINVTAVNDAPTLTFGTAMTIDEDAGPQTELGFATFDDGDPELTQSWASFNVTGATSDRGFSGVGTIFSSISFDTMTGDLSYELMPNVNGVITVTLTVTDGGEGFGGMGATSSPLMFTLTVNPVNDEPSVAVPSFSHEPVAANAQAPGIITGGFATPTFGPATAIDEIPPADPVTPQDVQDYIVSGPATLFGDLAFDVNPDIDNTGTLTYTTAAGVPTFGIAVVTVQLQDDGGTLLGGDNLSQPVDFYIVVGLPNPPELYNVEADNITLIVNPQGPGTADDLLEIYDTSLFTGVGGAGLLETYTLATLTDGLLIRGNANNNAITIDYTNGAPIPSGIGVILSGSLGNDTMNLVNGTVTSVDHTFAAADRGSFTIDDGLATERVVNYIQMESPITDNLATTTRSFTYSDVADDITLANSGAPGDGISSLTTATATALTVNFFTSAGAAVTVNTDSASGSGNDTLRVNGFDTTIASTSLNGFGGSDLLVGTASGNAFVINANDGGTLNTSSSFASFESLQGGAGADSFAFTDSTFALTGTINGLGGNDTLSYAAYSAGVGGNVTVTLSAAGTGSATRTGGVISIEAVLGGAGGDTLTGSSNHETLVGNDGNDSLDGGTGNDSLSGGNNDDTLVDGLGDDTLDGGAGNDTYVLTPGSADSLSDASGTDTLDFSGASAGVTINLDLTTAQTVFGVHTVQLASGTFENFIGSAFADVVTVTSNSTTAPARTINGNGGSDTLIGPNAANTWNITASNAGNIQNTSPATFLNFSSVENLTGGSSSDSFVFSDGVGVSGVINGGSGTNTLDYSAYTAANPVTVNLATGTATNVFGNAAGGISGFAVVFGGAGNDSLTGDASANTLVGNGGNDTLTDGLGNDSLDGGSGDDVYVLTPGSADTVNDSSGSDTLNFSGASAGVTIDLDNVSTAQTVFGANTVRLVGGTFEGFIGSAFNDTVTAAVIGSPRTINGNGGTGDVLRAGNAANAWHITSPNAGDIGAPASYSFQNVENLRGGTSTDSFAFSGTGMVTGSIDGGSGSDSFDYSAVAGPVTVNLATSTASLTGGFVSIESFAGSASANDVFTGANVNTTWNITSNNTGTAGTTAFSGFENLNGGSANDTFILADGVGVTGTIHGNGGSDTLSYAAYLAANPVSVNFATGAATNLGGFASIESVTGGAGADSLTGHNLSNTWNLTGTGTGNFVNTNGTFSFGSFETLNGGNLSDNFLFGAAGVFTAINGGAGADTLNWSALGSARTVVLTGNDVSGFAGTETSLPGGFTGINAVVGSSASTDSLTGLNVESEWELDGSNRYIDKTTNRSLDFSSFELVVAGNDKNKFVVSGAQTFNLVGNSGDDEFVFNNGATLTGLVDGNGGNDTLNFAALTSPVSVNLTGATGNGFNGTVTPASLISGGFQDIDTVTGGNGSDTLNGISGVDATWNVGPGTTRTYVASGFTLNFTSLENLNGSSGIDTFNISGAQSANLNGGSNNDTFNFADGATLSGSLIGNTGNDTVSYAGNTAAVTLNLASLNSIETVIGGNGSDTLVGLAAGTAFNVSGANSGTAGGIAFQSFENLSGGNGADSFAFSDGGSLSGVVNGGLGNDSLNFSAMTAGRSITLTGLGSLGDGFTGTDAAITGGFTNINTLVGSTTGTDSLLGTNLPLSTWNLGVTQTYSAGGQLLTFSSFESLQGGTDNDQFNISGAQTVNLHGGMGGGLDTFTFANGATLNGTLDGGDGNDTLTFAAYTTAVSIQLTDNLAEGFSGSTLSPAGLVAGGFAGVDTLIGGSSGDSLTGLNDEALWEVDGTNRYSNPIISLTRFMDFLSFENLIGGPQNDTFVVTGNQSHNLFGGDGDDNFILDAVSNFTGTIDGGNGNDTFDLSAKPTGLSINVSSLTNLESVVGTAGSDTLVGAAGGNAFFITGPDEGFVGTVGFVGFENLTGSTAADSFTFANDSASLSGVINGATGTDTLDFSGMTMASSAQAIVLTSLGSSDGFNGTSTSLGGSFQNIDALVGTLVEDSLKGLNAASAWTSSGATVTYVSTRTLNFTGVENLLGGTGVDTFTLTGAAAVTSADGGDGNDTLNATGLANAISLFGGNGNDTLFGGLGDDSFDGGAGTDELRQTGDFDQTLDDASLIGQGTDTFTAIERFLLTGGASGNLIDASAFTLGAVTLVGGDGNDTLLGGSGNDLLQGGNDSDDLSGGEGNDTVDGGAGNDDSVSGGLGNDSLVGGTGTGDLVVEIGITGNVTLLASTMTGLGSDTYSGMEGALLVGDGGDNVFTTTAVSFAVTLMGGAGNDTLTAGSGSDQLFGEDGDDVLTGGLGNDSLSGGNDNDVLIETANTNFTLTDVSLTGVGNDVLAGDIENAKFTGGSSNNSMNASAFTLGSVTLIGGGGNDSLVGTDFTDSLDGGVGNDTLRGNGGDETLFGGAGNDSLDGGAGFDVLSGDAGNDTLLGGDDDDTLQGGAGTDSINGGAGNDLITDVGNFNFTLTATQLQGNGNDTFSSIEEALVVGGSSNNTLKITTFAGSATLQGGAGNDVLLGGNGADVLEGGEGNDTLNGGLGDDTLDGGNGTDQVQSVGAANYALTNAALVGAGSDVLIVIETARLTAASTGTSIDASGFDGNATLVGGNGADSIIGGSGNDSILGGKANDTLRGGDGNDTIDGGTENDVLHGDGGNDRLLGQAGNDGLFGEDGNDTLDGGTGNDTLDGGADHDSLLGQAGNDAMHGRDGNDTLNGGAGNDSIIGGAGNDNLIGGNNNDLLIGEDDNDTLSGQGGTDKLDGGAGANSFIGTSGDSITTIFEFTTGDFDALIAALP